MKKLSRSEVKGQGHMCTISVKCITAKASFLTVLSGGRAHVLYIINYR